MSSYTMSAAVCSVLLMLVVGSVAQTTVLHCQPGDLGCAKCQSSCDAIPLTALPECCEAFSVCCSTYSAACGDCAASAALDSHFPEYCCASFTDCCDLVPGLNLVAGFTAKQGSKLPNKDGQTKGDQRQSRTESVKDDPQAEPEPEPTPDSDTAVPAHGAALVAAADTSQTDSVVEQEQLPTRPTSAAAAAAQAAGQLEARSQPSQSTQAAAAAAPAPSEPRIRGRNRLTPAAAADEETAQPAAARGGSVRGAPRAAATPVATTSPGGAPAGAEAGEPSAPQSRSRLRQATDSARRHRPTAADKKVIQAASLDRRGRVTSRGRIIE